MWLKKGAELGNGACVTELINAYRQGLFGVPEDPIEAFRWVKVGWQMDFKNRQYDAHRQSEEMERLLTTYRSHLKVSLKQKGISDAETRKLLEQIQ
jgi:TPR repeat protein